VREDAAQSTVIADLRGCVIDAEPGRWGSDGGAGVADVGVEGAVGRACWFEVVGAGADPCRVLLGAPSAPEAFGWVHAIINIAQPAHNVVLFENERRWGGARAAFGPHYLLPGEWRWGDGRGAQLDQETRQLIDKSVGGLDAATPATMEEAGWLLRTVDNADAEGWRYAVTWGDEWQRDPEIPACSMVRRRVWERRERGTAAWTAAAEAREGTKAGSDVLQAYQSVQARLFAQLERAAVGLHGTYGCEVGVVAFDDRGRLREFVSAFGHDGDGKMKSDEEDTRRAMGRVLQRYSEATGTFDGADPSCAHCRQWQQARASESLEQAQRSQMIDLLSMGTTDASENSPHAAQTSPPGSPVQVREDQTGGKPMQARELRALLVPLMRDLGEAHSAAQRTQCLRSFVDMLNLVDDQVDSSDGAGIGGGHSSRSRQLARSTSLLPALEHERLTGLMQCRAVERLVLLRLARGLAVALQHENERAKAASADGDQATGQPDFERVCQEYYREAFTLWDWSDQDLGAALVIAQLPARKVLADGPRLTNTFINGEPLPLFGEVEGTVERQLAWLRSALQMIHSQLLGAFESWAIQNPNSRLPRLSLVQNAELSETLINTKVDMFTDLLEQDEREGSADSDVSLEDHPRLLNDVDVYILKCISQYGDNQFFGKFKQLFHDTPDIIARVPTAGRERRIEIRAAETVSARPSVGRRPVITDFIEVSIERGFCAELCYVPEDLEPVAAMQLRLLQHVEAHAGSQAFTTRGLVEVAPPRLHDAARASTSARAAVEAFHSLR
jgi:hypothetical protein